MEWLKDQKAPDAVASDLSRAPAAPSQAAPAADILSDYDTQLMLLVARGDQAAAATLVRRNFDRVSKYVARVVRNPRWVEDLAQDVFVQLLSNAPKYVPTGRFSTWLYRIATNTALNHLKRASVVHRSGVSAVADLDLADPASDGPDRQLNLDELRLRVAAAIETLPPNQRVALVLFEYENLSYEQIAVVLTVTVEAVRSLLTRARSSLRQQLDGLLG